VLFQLLAAKPNKPIIIVTDLGTYLHQLMGSTQACRSSTDHNHFTLQQHSQQLSTADCSAGTYELTDCRDDRQQPDINFGNS